MYLLKNIYCLIYALRIELKNCKKKNFNDEN